MSFAIKWISVLHLATYNVYLENDDEQQSMTMVMIKIPHFPMQEWTSCLSLQSGNIVSALPASEGELSWIVVECYSREKDKYEPQE